MQKTNRRLRVPFRNIKEQAIYQRCNSVSSIYADVFVFRKATKRVPGGFFTKTAAATLVAQYNQYFDFEVFDALSHLLTINSRCIYDHYF